MYSEPGVWRQEFAIEDGFGWLSRDEDENGNLRVYWDDPMDADRLPDIIYLNGEDESDAAAWVRLYWETVISRPTLVGAEVYRPTGVSTAEVTQSVQYYHLVEVESELRVMHLEVEDGLFTGAWVVVKDPLSPLDDLVPSEDIGTEGDLVQVVRRIAVDPGEPTTEWRSIITQYRYHDGDLVREDQGESFDIRLDIEGLAHQLKSTFEPQQIEFMAQKRSAETTPDGGTLLFVATELLAVDDDGEAFSESSASVQVIGVATKILGYSGEVANVLNPVQTDSPVISQVLQAGSCGCGGGGAIGAVLLDYDRFGWVNGASQTGLTTHMREHALASFDAWPASSAADRTHCVDLINLERGTDKFPFLLHQAVVEGDVAAMTLGRAWVTSNSYNGTTHARTEVRSPSFLATSGYTPAITPGGPGLGAAPSITTSDTAGLVTKFTYDGEHVGQLRVGTLTSSGLVRATEFVSDGNESRRRLIHEEKMYRVAASSNPNDQELVGYAYGFEAVDSAKLDWRSVTVERELVSENGPGSASATSWDFFDDRGQRIVSLDADGIATRFEHDPRTGQIVRITRNYDPGSVSSIPEIRLPTGEDGEPDDPFDTLVANGDGTLVTEYEYDLMGRLTKVIRPGGVESWTVRRMAEDPDRPGILYYQTISLPHLVTASPRTFAGPARLRWMDAASQTTRSESWSVDPAEDYDPDAGDYEFATELARSTTTHDLSGAAVASRQWWNIAEDLAYETTYAYDALGRLKSTVDGTGTKTTREHDVLDRVTEVAVGTTASSPLPVAKYYYDGDPGSSSASGVGNGNLTHVERFDGAGTRLTRMYYDKRDRLIATVADAAPMSVTRYDNLDRPIESAVYPTPDTVPSLADVIDAAVGALPHDGETAFDQTGPLDRAWHTKTSYSQRGLVYREEVAIDASQSSPDYLAWNWWYDDDGHEIASWAPNSPGTITGYDAHHRVVRSVLTDRGGDGDDALGTADRFTEAARADGDAVIEQTGYAYAPGSGVLELVTHMMRHHAAAGTGDPDDDEFVTTYSGTVYDSALRPVGSVDFGTNKAAFGVTAAGAPDLTDYDTLGELLAASGVLFAWTEYDERGRVGAVVGTQTGAEEIRTAYVYDDLGRTAAVVENAVNAVVSWDDTEERYTAAGLSTGHPDRDRVTSFVYDAAGNVVRRIAHLPHTSGEKVQETRYDYGVTAEGSPSSPTHSLVSSSRLLYTVRYPDESTGAAGSGGTYTVTYGYNRLGELRGMSDQNGTVHSYTRDALGRVVSDEVTSFGTNIDNRVVAITTGYDDHGRVAAVLSLDSVEDELNGVEFGYTGLHQVETVAQHLSYSAGVPDRTGVVTYAYADAAPAAGGTGNHSRLTSITYPNEDGGDPTVLIGYGAAGSIGDRISRVAGLGVDGWASGTDDLVDYTYLGASIPVKVRYPATVGGLALDAIRGRFGDDGAAEDRYYGFDQYGRVVWHGWVTDGFAPRGGIYTDTPNRTPLFGRAYGYDMDSNRVQDFDARPGAVRADRDWAYQYDDLDRLTQANRGRESSGFTLAAGSQKWNLDILGNWKMVWGDANGNGSFEATIAEQESRTHNRANEITVQERPGGMTSQVVTQPGYDDAGNYRQNLGSGSSRLVYTHDAWNRLVKIVRTSGSHTVLENEFNGLNHRIRRRMDLSQGAYDGVDEARWYFYSAEWQMIEEHIDADDDGDTDRIGQQFWGVRYIDDAVGRRIDRDADGDWTTSPSDNFYYLTDVMFGVRAVVDSSGLLHTRLDYTPYGVAMHGYGADVNGDGVVTISDLGVVSANYNGGSELKPGDVGYDPDAFLDGEDEINLTAYLSRYTPYVAGPSFNNGWIDNPDDVNGPDNSVGYDGYWFDLAGATEATSTGLYTVRHRVYDPKLGRWLQRDPAGAEHAPDFGLEVATKPALGSADSNWGKDFANLYQYARGSPPVRQDPSGLRCCIAMSCSSVKRFGVRLGSHCGLVFCDNGGCFSYDGSGGNVHRPVIKPYNNSRSQSTGSLNCNFPDSTCQCIRNEQARWNQMNIPRDHFCANSNWHLKCVTSKCGINVTWPGGNSPIGWNCRGYISGYACTGTYYDSDFWGPNTPEYTPIYSPCP